MTMPGHPCAYLSFLQSSHAIFTLPNVTLGSPRARLYLLRPGIVLVSPSHALGAMQVCFDYEAISVAAGTGAV